MLTTRARGGGPKRCSTTGADGRHSYAVLEAVPSGTILENSLCVEVSVPVVDQFPFLWDFVLTGETENEYTDCQHNSASSRAHIACVFADQGEGNIGERAEMVLCFHFSIRSLSSNSQSHIIPSPLDYMTWV